MAKSTARTRLRLAAAAFILTVPLAACGDSSDPAADTTTAESDMTSGTLAVALAANDDLGQVSKALKDSGLAQVFDGTAAYTILAPTDAAFAAEDTAMPADDAAAQPLLIARMREHVLPGALTPEDIAAAIEAQSGTVKMATMGDGSLTFSADGDAIRVTDEDGVSGTLAKDAILASNGVAIPIDTVLHRP